MSFPDGWVFATARYCVGFDSIADSIPLVVDSLGFGFLDILLLLTAFFVVVLVTSLRAAAAGLDAKFFALFGTQQEHGKDADGRRVVVGQIHTQQGNAGHGNDETEHGGSHDAQVKATKEAPTRDGELVGLEDRQSRCNHPQGGHEPVQKGPILGQSHEASPIGGPKGRQKYNHEKEDHHLEAFFEV